QQMGLQNEAVQAFQNAIRVEPYLAGARSNLASLYEQGGYNADEVRRRREEEVKLLARDAKLLPDNATAQYRYALTLYLLGREAEAATALERAVELEPTSYDFRLMLTLLYEKQTRW